MFEYAVADNSPLNLKFDEPTMGNVRGQFGMTLVEVLVAVAILTILLAISFPAVQSLRESSKRIDCVNRQRQLTVALHHFEGSKMNFPPTIGARLQHWQSQLIAFLGEGGLDNEIEHGFEAIQYPIHHPAGMETVPQLQCPSNPDKGLLFGSRLGSFAFTDYCGVAGISLLNGPGVFVGYGDKGVTTHEIADGLSNTLAFGERPASSAGHGFGRWFASQNQRSATIGVFEDFDDLLSNAESNEMEECLPSHVGYRLGIQRSTFDWMHHWSFHSSGCNFSRIDGSVHFIPYSIDAATLKSLATRAGGETVSPEY